jgi:hypothetical protein
MPFQPGQSGNPAGRPRGSRNKGTVIAEKLLDDSAGALTTAAIKCATEGDPAALRACMDRIAPRLRHRPLDFALPSLVTLADTPGAINAIAQGLAHGELDRDEAVVLMRAVREFTLALAAVEREKRATGSAAPPNDDAASGGETLADFLARRTREAESGIATLAPVHDGRRQHEPEEPRQEHGHDARRDQAAASGPHAARTPPQPTRRHDDADRQHDQRRVEHRNGFEAVRDRVAPVVDHRDGARAPRAEENEADHDAYAAQRARMTSIRLTDDAHGGHGQSCRAGKACAGHVSRRTGQRFTPSGAGVAGCARATPSGHALGAP